jgi:hypothetical protein
VDIVRWNAGTFDTWREEVSQDPTRGNLAFDDTTTNREADNKCFISLLVLSSVCYRHTIAA